MKRACLLTLLLFLRLATIGEPAAPQQKKAAVVLFPRLAKGQVLRYQFGFHTTSKSSTTSVIVDPAASIQLELSLSIALRLEVLNVQPGPAGADSHAVVRMHATFERVAATQRSDDPASDDNEAAHRAAQLEGRSFECTLDGGAVRECSGSGTPLPGTSAELRGWLTQILGTRNLPQNGILPGETWGDEQEVGGGIPLADVRWVRQLTYVGNEPCQPGAAAPPKGDASAHSATSSTKSEMCAVIRMRSLLIRKDERRDATPEAFREKGLRTAGTARGANESLTRVSLESGLVVSAVESGWKTTDITVSTADGERKIRTVTELKSDSALTLVSAAP